MGRFSREEIDAAFQHFQEAADQSAKSGDWRAWSECFTEDADYYEHHYGKMHGRAGDLRVDPGHDDGSRPSRTCATSRSTGTSSTRTGAGCSCSVWNEMDDPGDGSLHREYNWTMLHYAGDGRFSYEEDLYNPVEFGRMVQRWHEVKDRLAGTAKN